MNEYENEGTRRAYILGYKKAMNDLQSEVEKEYHNICNRNITTTAFFWIIGKIEKMKEKIEREDA